MGTFVEVCWPFTTNEPLNALSWLPSPSKAVFRSDGNGSQDRVSHREGRVRDGWAQDEWE